MTTDPLPRPLVRRRVHIRTRWADIRAGEREPVIVRVRYGLGVRWRDWRDFPDERRKVGRR